MFVCIFCADSDNHNASSATELTADDCISLWLDIHVLSRLLRLKLFLFAHNFISVSAMVLSAVVTV